MTKIYMYLNQISKFKNSNRTIYIYIYIYIHPLPNSFTEINTKIMC